jgi:hypothetical protein
LKDDEDVIGKDANDKDEKYEEQELEDNEDEDDDNNDCNEDGSCDGDVCERRDKKEDPDENVEKGGDEGEGEDIGSSDVRLISINSFPPLINTHPFDISTKSMQINHVFRVRQKKRQIKKHTDFKTITKSSNTFHHNRENTSTHSLDCKQIDRSTKME